MLIQIRCVCVEESVYLLSFMVLHSSVVMAKKILHIVCLYLSYLSKKKYIVLLLINTSGPEIVIFIGYLAYIKNNGQESHLSNKQFIFGSRRGNFDRGD